MLALVPWTHSQARTLTGLRGERPNRTPVPRGRSGAPGIRVLLLGRKWDSLAASLATLSGHGEFAFVGPAARLARDARISVGLVSPEAPVSARSLGADGNAARRLPILRCVRGDELAVEDPYADADDFVTIPCTAAELGRRLARLARAPLLPDEGAGDTRLRLHQITLDTGTYHVAVNGTPATLTWMEFHLLKFLMENPGRVFRRDEILHRVWGPGYNGGPRTVDVHIRRLRHKLAGEGERWLRTVRNVGYALGDA